MIETVSPCARVWQGWPLWEGGALEKKGEPAQGGLHATCKLCLQVTKGGPRLPAAVAGFAGPEERTWAGFAGPEERTWAGFAGPEERTWGVKGNSFQELLAVQLWEEPSCSQSLLMETWTGSSGSELPRAGGVQPKMGANGQLDGTSPV